MSQFFGADLPYLEKLMDLHELQSGASRTLLQAQGGAIDLAKKIKTDLSKGLNSDDANDIKLRKQSFGDNTSIPKYQQTLWDIILENFEDLVLQVLIGAAVVSTILGIYTTGWKQGWYDGVSILVAVVIVTTVNSVNNYQKLKQFEKLYQLSAVHNINLIRNGVEVYTTDEKLLTGDIIRVETGQIMSVDGILIKNNDLIVDESLITGESREIKKTDNINATDRSVFILSGSKIVEGSGLVMVLCVGTHSNYGKIKASIQGEVEQTPLQVKLEDIVIILTKIGIGFGVFAFVTLVTRYSVKCFISSDVKSCFIRNATINQLVSDFMVGVVLLVLAIPEGLPVAVTIALAFSIDKMKEENNLVRYLSACETMGGANNICSDKTGTLTTNIMTITDAYIQQQKLKITSKISISALVSKQYQNVLINSICQNSSAAPVYKNDKFVHIGNRTECALLEMVEHMGFKYNQIRNKQNMIATYQFSSKTKKMTTVYKQANKMYVFVKGGPDIILGSCSYYVDKAGKICPLDEKSRATIYEVQKGYMANALRTLAIAYKQIRSSTIGKSREDQETSFIFLGIFGVKDPLKDHVPEAVQQFKTAGIKVRMVTGDAKETAVAIAKQAGILSHDYNPELHPYAVMEGRDFAKYVGGILNKGTEQETVGDIHNFETVANQLVVMARSSPDDKYILTSGLKQLGEVVAVTGDGTNDAPSLKKADIGFAMGIAGTEVAKQASGIILMDDNFGSILVAVKWGRNIFNGVRKFIQFQLIINFVVSILTVIGSVVFDEAPFNTLQMLWINLIMDTFAALALATEAPTDDILLQKPYSRHQNIITSHMLRTIIIQSGFQIAILGVLMGFGSTLLNVADSFNIRKQNWNAENSRLACYFFTIFVYLQVFNEFNCRKIKNEYNVFEGLLKHKLFWFIIFISVGVQIVLVQFAGVLMHCTPLSALEHLCCLGVASTTIPFMFLTKVVLPEHISISWYGIEWGTCRWQWRDKPQQLQQS